MVDSMSTRCQQRMGALYRVRDFLGPRGFIVASKSFAVSMAVLQSWVLQPPIYLNLTLYRRWRKGFVDVNFLHCILVVKQVQ